MIRIVIADDHHMVRAGLKVLLEQEENIEVVGEAANGQETLEIVEKVNPDIIILDIGMPKLNGIQTLRQLRDLKIDSKIIVLTMYSNAAFIRQSLQYGAKGYLLKSSVSDELPLAIWAVYRGEVFLSPAISGFVLSGFLNYQKTKPPVDGFDTLSAREVEVLQLIAEGHTNRAIGNLLFISTKTVDKHRASLIEKLNVRDTAGLIREAIKNKLVFLD